MARIRYAGEGEVSLPGYLNATPSIVRPGDVFEIDDAFAAALLDADDDRWKAAPDDAPLPTPYDDLNGSDLTEELANRVEAGTVTESDVKAARTNAAKRALLAASDTPTPEIPPEGNPE